MNRSMPPGVIIPELPYSDVRKAVDWLCRSFGFTERLRIGDHRAQLTFGTGSIIVTQSKDSPAASVMVRVDNIDDHYAQAEQSGVYTARRPIIPMESDNTLPKILVGIAGFSLRALRMLILQYGVVLYSSKQPVFAVHASFRQSGVVSPRPPMPVKGITQSVRRLISHWRGSLKEFELQVLKGDPVWPD